MFIFFVVCNSSVVFTRLFLNALGDGGGGDSGVGSAAHQVGRVEEMSEEKEVGGVHQSAVLKEACVPQAENVKILLQDLSAVTELRFAC